MRIVITGSNGLLGQKLVRQLKKNNVAFIATSKGENRNVDCSEETYRSMDILDASGFKDLLKEFNATHLIHTAAITNVDYCELNPEECDKINHQSVLQLVDVCRELDVHFQLLSTDFVFDGSTGNYKETDEVCPLSYYALSKVNAEIAVQNSGYSNWSIVRTIIVYGSGSNLSRSNLIYWSKEALESGKELSIVDDQFRAPTWADDLAWGCLRICFLKENGIYHLSGPETFSIYEIVQKVGKYFHLDIRNVKKSSSASIQQPAKRPPKTGFDLTKARKKLGYNPKSLEETFKLL